MLERFFTEIWNVVLQLSGPLLLGSLIAGIIHVIVPSSFINRKLGKKGIRSVINAAIIGVPMPLCSCSVVPTTIGLKQDGATDGASTSFLISTPQTGVDSILVSGSFLGWPFAIFKVAAAFVTGIIGGILVDKTDKNPERQIDVDIRDVNIKKLNSRIWETLRYGLFDLLGMIYRWIILGIVIAAIISIIFPPGALSHYDWIGGIWGMFLMLVIALPMYVCTTGSVPIAASLIAAGMPTGTALVFLMAGPASNVATIGAIYRAFGKRVLAIYLASVAVFSVLFGYLFSWVITQGQTMAHHHQHEEMAGWFTVATAILVIGLFVFLAAYDLYRKYWLTPRVLKETDRNMPIELNIKGMTCKHCAITVTKALQGVPGVTKADVYLESNLAVIEGNPDVASLIKSVHDAGYEASAKA
jgi:uncharacterized membrane protein YraQ (UPF0718 family)/copper chaperone CopZ